MTENGKNCTKNEMEDLQQKTDLHLNTLKELCQNNADYFEKDSSENGQRLYISFLGIKDNLDSLAPKIFRIQQKAPSFDFDKNTPGNGYRSFLTVVEAAVDLAIQLNKKVMLKRDSVLFMKGSLTKDVESASYLLASLDTCLKHLETILSWSSNGCLFPNEEHSPQELLSQCEDINQYCFYGRSMGFQFCESLRHFLQFIALSMAVFSEAYYTRGSLFSKATNSVVTTTKYLTDPEQRAKRIVRISQNADIDFCKSFWFLSEGELMSHMPSMVSSSVAVSKIIHLAPEPLSLDVSGKKIEVPIPSAHIGRKAVQVRLISHDVREGMIGEAANKAKAKPPSKGLLIHCHGGGFVAQSSKSHECYLRDWAKQLNVPILSIDYSLAPEAPFPRAHEEVTYAYAWALKNCHLLGSTGERVVAAGDSAGANLLLSASLKCISLGIPTPAGLFLAYVPTLVNFIPSPARLLCMMDPMLPFGFMMRCLKAYACPDPNKIKSNGFVFTENMNSDTESFEEISESDLMELQAHKSPVSETSDTLTYGSLSSNINDEIDQDKDGELTANDVEQSQKYVSEFLEKYAIDSDTETTDATKVQTVNSASAASSQSCENSFHSRVSSLVTNLKSRFTNMLGTRIVTDADKYLDVDRQTSLLEEFKFNVPQDPYLSPYMASDDVLRQLPPVKVLTVELDPCLDDCVMFAKRLKSLEKDVTLDILKGLPHGFLNFSLISKEAHDGSKLCVKRIKELFNLSEDK